MVERTGHRRFRLSIRALMIAVALCALFLAPAIWIFRELELREAMARMAAEHARAQAERALYVAQLNSAQAGFSALKQCNSVQPKTGNLWAALSTNHAVFKAEQTKDLRIEFTLVNDGDKVIDPKIAESHIVINGKELTDSGSILKRSLKDATIRALSPGDTLQFGVVLGDYLKEPGLYRVSWKGAGFQSSEIVLRVLPEKAEKPK